MKLCKFKPKPQHTFWLPPLLLLEILQLSAYEPAQASLLDAERHKIQLPLLSWPKAILPPNKRTGLS